MVEIISLVVSSVALVTLIILLIVLFKNKNKPKDDKEFGALSKQLDMLSTQIKDNIKNDIELALAKEMIKLEQSGNKNSEANNDKLERFQKNITESLNNRFDAITKQVNDRLLEMNQKVDNKLQEGFKGTSETIIQVRERLQAIDDAQKNIESLSKDVVSLKQVLEGNQSRGQYGEYQLQMVLHNVFGDTIGCYEEQYTLKKVKDGDDVRADAVVFMPEPNKMICIDSKFPFQDYARVFEIEDKEEKEKYTKEFGVAVKKHITVIKDKYIVDGKTAPQALMFIPNDGVFAFIHHNLPDVVSYARDKNVILTSPSTLPAILFTINMIRVEAERAKNVQVISKQLNGLGQQFERFSEEWRKFSNQLDTATKSRERLDTRVGRITGKFDAIKNNSPIKEIENEETEDINDQTI